MSAMGTDTTGIGHGENEDATLRDRKEGERNTSDQCSQREGSAQEDSEQEEHKEYESDVYSDEYSNEYSDEYSNADDDNFGRGKKRNARSPKYCPICLKTTELSKCLGCDDMAYCSRACQRKDWPVHKLLCRKLPVIQATSRPEEHFRAILFPANDVGAGEYLLEAEAPKPKFVWAQKGLYSSYFPPDGSCEGQSYDRTLMGRRQQVSTQQLIILNPSIMGDKPRNSCIEAVVGNRLLMKPWPLPGWRGNLLVVGCTGDVTMRDFRAIVDYFQCYPQNRGLVDPSRYLGHTTVGVLTVPASQIGDPAVESKVHEVQEIHMTEVMKFYKKENPMNSFDGILPICVLSLGENTSYLRMVSTYEINLNTGSLLFMVHASMEHLGEVLLPIQPLSCGALIYLRVDGKPLLKHHYEALSAFAHSEVIQAAGAQGLSESELAKALGYRAMRQDLEKQLTKDNFRKFWAGYCKSKRLEATTCPLDM